MNALLQRYRDFLRLPDVLSTVVLTTLSRMPVGMMSLSMLLHVRAIEGTFAFAGIVVGSYMVALAVAAPVVGRWIDRHGPRGLLLVSAVVAPLALALLLAAAWWPLPGWSMIAAAVVAGLSMPPTMVLTRSVWRHRFEGESERRLAFALDMVLVETVFTLGPGLVALLVALASPAAAFAAAFVSALLSVPLFMRSPAIRYLHRDPHAERHLLGPLTEPRLLVVFAASFLLLIAFGALEVGYSAFGAHAGVLAAAGLMMALQSITSGLGGLAYGALPLKLSPEQRLPRLLALLIVPLAAHLPTTTLPVLSIWVALSGFVIAPALTTISLLVSAYAPRRYTTEAFTWSTTAIVAGLGTGHAIGGQLVERFGQNGAFTLAVVATASAALVPAALSTMRKR